MGLSAADLGFDGEEGSAWSEIALRFTLTYAEVGIVGTTDPGNAKANIAAALKGSLPEETVQTIRQAFHRAEDASGERWPGLT